MFLMLIYVSYQACQVNIIKLHQLKSLAMDQKIQMLQNQSIILLYYQVYHRFGQPLIGVLFLSARYTQFKLN